MLAYGGLVWLFTYDSGGKQYSGLQIRVMFTPMSCQDIQYPAPLQKQRQSTSSAGNPSRDKRIIGNDSLPF